MVGLRKSEQSVYLVVLRNDDKVQIPVWPWWQVRLPMDIVLVGPPKAQVLALVATSSLSKRPIRMLVRAKGIRLGLKSCGRRIASFSTSKQTRFGFTSIDYEKSTIWSKGWITYNSTEVHLPVFSLQLPFVPLAQANRRQLSQRSSLRGAEP
jgi:hypothetical protein